MIKIELLSEYERVVMEKTPLRAVGSQSLITPVVTMVWCYVLEIEEENHLEGGTRKNHISISHVPIFSLNSKKEKQSWLYCPCGHHPTLHLIEVVNIGAEVTLSVT